MSAATSVLVESIGLFIQCSPVVSPTERGVYIIAASDIKATIMYRERINLCPGVILRNQGLF
jgi:hypothetical protein